MKVGDEQKKLLSVPCDGALGESARLAVDQALAELLLKSVTEN